MKSSLPIEFFACSWQSAQDEVRQQRDCDWWIYDWPGVDFYWLFGDRYPAILPLPDHSPLARRYYDQITSEINNATSQAYSQCESRHYASQSEPETGLRLTVSSRLEQGGVTRGSSTETSGIDARLSIAFAAGAGPDTQACPMLPRELFTQPVGFDYTLYGTEGGNFRWELTDQPDVTPISDPYFELYGRTLKFYSSSGGSQFLGNLHLMIDRVADLWVDFESRPIPSSVADRIDPAQPLSYQVSQGGGYFGIAVVIEITHLASGNTWYQNADGSNPAGQLLPLGWPSEWEQMSMDQDGIIRHSGINWSRGLYALDPALINLPTVGTYRLRAILLAYQYLTYERNVIGNVSGVTGDTRMSWKPIMLSLTPSLISYTPGMTNGMFAPFEFTYERGPTLSTGIEFDAVFDMKNLTTFRFVVKVGNTFDFPIGLIVTASGMQAWVSLGPGETKCLAGGISISGMFSWDAYPLHPNAPYYGWGANWGSTYISMLNGQCSIPFGLVLTAPNNPETLPAGMPAKKTVRSLYWDPSTSGSPYEPIFGAIKRYSQDGQYDYEYNLNARSIITLSPSIGKPAYRPLIDPGTYFGDGYETHLYDWVSPWHKRPWPWYSGWGIASAQIMIQGERWIWDGTQNVLTTVDGAVNLSREMMQQIAAMLGVTEYAVMDGDDIRWLTPHPTLYSWHSVMWVDKFYTRSGTLIDDAAMRSAFQTMVDDIFATSPGPYMSMTVHPSVRFGSFLDNGGFEVGDYLLGPSGEMVEVGGLSDLGSLSTRFLYYIKPEFR